MKGKLTRWVSVLMIAALLIPSGWLVPSVAKAESQDIPVILYHRIVQTPSNEWTDTSIDKFKSMMQYLHDHDYTTLTSQQYVEILSGEATTIPEKPILLTFDDATPDFVTNALPILEELDMNAVLFVVTDWIDGGYSMSSEQLQKLADDHPNVSIENHTVNHESDGYWKNVNQADASAAIAKANADLKAVTGKDPLLFAFPYGDFNPAVQAAAEENGIHYAFKVGYPNSGNYAMGRHYVMMNTTLSELAGWIGGPAPSPEAPVEQDPVVVYHETFENGQGAATQSGDAKLSVVEKTFDGNSDDAALYVENRTNDWDAADFPFDKLGLKNGETYQVTVSVYVDEGVEVPEGAQAFLQTVSSYSWLAGVNYTAGNAITLQANLTVDTENDSALRVQSNAVGAPVPFYIGDILITQQPKEVEEPQEIVVYHETFKDGAGVATQAGSNLTAVTDVVFEGNEDGHAIHITDRSANWHGADIPFDKVNMENGKTYTITVKGYIADDVTVPAGAQVLVQNVDKYQGLYLQANMEAGKSFTATGTHTVDTTPTEDGTFDRAFRIQSNDAGANVPFYVGDIVITTMAASEEEPEDDRPPAKEFTPITFDDEQFGGFVGRHGDEILTITDEANHTEDGKFALKVENRNENWHGPSLRVEEYVNRGHEYKVSAWVKLISPATAQLQLSTQVGNGDGASYNNLQGKTVSVDDGWVQLEGTYRYSSVGNEYLSIYVESSNNSTASFYIDDVTFEPTGTGVVDIERDLTPLKDVYKDDFLIGNAVSLGEFDGTRLELLKLHHNLISAENAMKPSYAYDEQGEFDFTAEDQLVQKALDEGFKIHGHVLVWHQQSREALHTGEDGKPLPREEAIKNLETHVKTVVEHFGDKVISWDVVNEAMNDNPPNPSDWRDSLRQSGWLQAIGDDYLELAYRFAKEVIDENGWDIKLYYNDYNDDNQRKAEAIYQMVKEINEKYAEENDGELLIDGIGMQAHYNLNTNPENVRLSMEKFISLGVEVGITELDITAGSDNVLTEQQAQQQAYLYAQLFKLYKEKAEHISRVTLWGLNDATSWRAAQSPLLFDRDMKAKPAYYAVLNPEKFIEEYDGGEDVEANQGKALFGTPTIDGEIDAAWNNAPALQINRYQMAWQGANGIAKALWDEDHLYVLFQVSDSNLDDSSADPWEQDSVEVFVDENNEKTTFFQEDDGQYRVNFKNVASFNPSNIDEGFESAVSTSEAGYTVEVKIPFKTITAQHNTEIGFDLQINDGQNGARQSIATWNDLTGQGFQSTSVFGNLTLVTTLDEPGSNPNPNPSPGTVTTPPADNTDPNAVVPEVSTVNNRVVGKITADQLKNTLAKATADANGVKQLNIELSKQANATGYDVQLPVQGLQDQQAVFTITTEFGTITLSGEALLKAAGDADQLTIRITPASADGLNETAREKVGDRPAVQVSLLANNNEAVESLNGLTIAIPYTPSNEENSNTDNLVVLRMDSMGNTTVVTNGRYDAASGTVVFETNEPGSFAVAYASNSFEDTAAVPWAKQAIDAMAAREIINGVSPSSYAPQQSINRADFITLLVRALNLNAEVSDESAFSDVEQSAYYYNELAIARALGIASGYSDNSFKPGEEISRQDMMVLTVRALAAAGIDLNADGSLAQFSDSDDVAAYAQAQAAALVDAGIINGKNGKIAPQDSLTRAEAAVILHRIWKL